MEKYSGVSSETHALIKRLEKVWDWMAQEGIALVMLEDSESKRDQNIRWLTGHPNDALLFLSVDRKALLAAWDINLAKIYACKSPVTIVSYNDFDRTPIKALTAAAKTMRIPPGSKIEIPSVTPYPAFLKFVGELTDYDIICREKSAASEISKMRAVKDDEEIAVIKKAAGFTNEIIDLLEKNVKSGKIKTEIDAAMFIQIEARKRGCEGTSFETLAAGPERSYAIHAFPSSTCASFGTQGLSILDFGLKYNGYCTDVTLTFTCGLNPKQEKLVSLVEKASKLTVPMSHNGTQARDIAAAADTFFKKNKKEMPHGLGHGLGLQEHEYPLIRNKSDNDWVLEPGMIFTIEPGLYDPILGGCRLENDILITQDGYEVLTSARIINL
ncbi:MAG: Xaa-Pro peptidase family protein [Treponema sp.]|nr:Xaa-Pro peptidase family protein [Treponema sp.]MCL2251311.1 Xaa-Pro peptidase family protein [Treponema sp.]